MDFRNISDLRGTKPRRRDKVADYGGVSLVCQITYNF